MTHPRELIMTAWRDLLLSIPSIRVERNRVIDTTPDDCPMVILLEGSQKARHATFGITHYQMEIELECFVISDEGETLGTAVNALYQTIIQKAKEDVSLNGLVDDLTEDQLQMEVGRISSHTPNAAFLLTFNVLYHTTST